MTELMNNTSQRQLTFPGAFGEQLAARLDMPADQEPAAYALLAHCFTCSKDLKAINRISRALAHRGLGVLRFDFTGLGESEGDFADTNFSSNVDDLEAAARFLETHHAPPRLLIGHSLGGTAVLASGARLSNISAVATIGAPSDTEHIRQRLIAQTPELQNRGEAELHLAGRPFRIREQLLTDLAEHQVHQRIRQLNQPLLVFHSPVDEIVSIDHARRIFELARHPKSFVSLDDADHLLTRTADARYVAEVLAAWAGRYLSDPRDA
jgi:putative redox protein